MVSSIAIVTSANARHASSAEVTSASARHARSAEVTSAGSTHVRSAEVTSAETENYAVPVRTWPAPAPIITVE